MRIGDEAREDLGRSNTGHEMQNLKEENVERIDKVIVHEPSEDVLNSCAKMADEWHILKTLPASAAFKSVVFTRYYVRDRSLEGCRGSVYTTLNVEYDDLEPEITARRVMYELACCGQASQWIEASAEGDVAKGRTEGYQVQHIIEWSDGLCQSRTNISFLSANSQWEELSV